MGSSCSTVACIKSNHMTLRCIGSRFITWHYIHIYVVSSIAIYLVKTHNFFLSRQVYDFPARTPLNFYAMWSVWYFGWWETTRPPKLICLGDSTSLPRQFGNMILFKHSNCIGKCHTRIAVLTKRVAGYLYLNLTAASQATAVFPPSIGSIVTTSARLKPKSSPETSAGWKLDVWGITEILLGFWWYLPEKVWSLEMPIFVEGTRKVERP